MIGRLSGRVVELGEGYGILDVGGVGYEVFLPGRALAALRLGEAAQLHIETHVREDQIKLYGFLSREDRQWFALLQSVQGVGARMALALLDQSDGEGLGAAIALQDAAKLQKAQGVGAKLAKRILSELKDRLPAPSLAREATALPTGEASAPLAEAPLTGLTPDLRTDAISALSNLGLDPSEARLAVAQAEAELTETPSLPELIRRALHHHGAQRSLETPAKRLGGEG